MVHRVSHRHGNGHVYADLGPADGLLSGYDRGGTHALHDPLGRIAGISCDSGGWHRLCTCLFGSGRSSRPLGRLRGGLDFGLRRPRSSRANTRRLLVVFGSIAHLVLGRNVRAMPSGSA